MTINDRLRETVESLEKAGIETARLDALVLLEDVLGIDRAQLLANGDVEISTAQLAELKKLFKRRLEHEPLAYIRGKTEFYGREFIVTPDVLVPRPESETMIELLKVVVQNQFLGLKERVDLKIADVGTGSGALGITAKLELAGLKDMQLELLEIDPAAVAVAQKNVDKYTMDVAIIESDLLAMSCRDYDILLCNLPYVPNEYPINQAATHEPRLALFGGADGLDLYRRLFEQIASFRKKPLLLLTEVLPVQHTALQAVGAAHGYRLARTDDFIQLFQPDI